MLLNCWKASLPMTAAILQTKDPKRLQRSLLGLSDYSLNPFGK